MASFLIGFLLGVAASVLSGVLLWMFLPRGAFLAKTAMGIDPNGIFPAMPQTTWPRWQILNGSTQVIEITSVTYEGINTMSPDGRLLRLDLPESTSPEETATRGVVIAFADSELEMARECSGDPWKGQRLPPGERLDVWVNLNRSVIVKYKRCGWTGAFERRELRIDVGP